MKQFTAWAYKMGPFLLFCIVILPHFCKFRIRCVQESRNIINIHTQVPIEGTQRKTNPIEKENAYRDI